MAKGWAKWALPGLDNRHVKPATKALALYITDWANAAGYPGVTIGSAYRLIGYYDHRSGRAADIMVTQPGKYAPQPWSPGALEAMAKELIRLDKAGQIKLEKVIIQARQYRPRQTPGSKPHPIGRWYGYGGKAHNDHLHFTLAEGSPVVGPHAGSVAPSAPARRATAPAPKAPAFPLAGVLRWGPNPYYGPKAGPTRSRSGYFNPADRAAVRAIQTRLLALGYKPGATDGHYGSSTRAAVRAFQSRNDIRADGLVGAQTWAPLFGPSARRA